MFDRLIEPMLLPVDLGPSDEGAVLPRVELDRLFQVGDRLDPFPALEPHQAAIRQESVTEPPARIALERFTIIGLGGRRIIPIWPEANPRSR